MSLPAIAEIEYADWPALKQMCESLGLNPKGRSDVVRMRVMDHVRRRTRPEAWRLEREHEAALLARLGFPEVSAKIWESTIRLDAPAPWVGLGQAHMAAGRLQEAGKAFDRAVQMGDPSAALHRAAALAASGDTEHAARACDAHLAANPREVRALALKASYVAQSGFVDEAARILRTAAEVHPELSGIASALGVLLLKAGRAAEAAEAFHEAIRRDPSDVDAWTNRGAALLLAGRTREAIGSLREANERNPLGADVLNNLGVAYLALGHAKSAQTNFERAAKLLETPRIVLNLARIREASQEPHDALRAVDQVLRMEPKESEALAARRRLAPAARDPSSQSKSARRAPAKPRSATRRRKKPTRRSSRKR